MVFLQRIIIVVFLLINVSFVESVYAQSVANIAGEAGFLKSASDDRQVFANNIKEQARGYRELEANARDHAQNAKDPTDKAMWEDMAHMHGAKARQLEDQAASEAQKAAEEASQARELEEQARAQATEESAQFKQPLSDRYSTNDDASEPACRFEEPHELVGLWRYEGNEDADSFAIVQEDPETLAYPNRLELHGFERVWKGRFNSNPNLPTDNEPQLTFKYKPKANEINPDIPDWGREQLAGELEWELEVYAECDGGAVMPHVMFFPGEIEWDEAAQTVEIKDRGEGRRINLVPATHTLAESSANASIGIWIDPRNDPFINPIEALTKRQRFNVIVRLPQELAEEVGGVITVNIKGKTSGDSDTVELKAGQARGNRPVRYMAEEVVTIADRVDIDELPRNQPILSMNWLMGNTGQKLDLEVENGEIIEVSYRDMSFEVPIYNTAIQRGVARFAEGAERLRAIYGSILQGPFPRNQKENTHKRLRMLRNYDALMASDALTDVHRYNLGELYMGDPMQKTVLSAQQAAAASPKPRDVGMLNMTDAQLESAYQSFKERAGSITQDDLSDPVNPLAKAALEGMTGKDLSSQSTSAMANISWVFPAEEQQVEKTIRKTTTRLRGDLMELVHKEFAFGMYQAIVATTNVENAYIAFYGKDAFNRKVPEWVRMQAALGIASGTVLRVAGAARAFGPGYKGKRVGLSKSSKNTYQTVGTRPIAALNRLKKPGVPKSLSAAQKKQTYVELVEEPPLPKKPGPTLGGCGSTGPRTPISVEDGLKLLDDELFSDLHKDASWLEPRYPKSARIIEDHSDRFTKQISSLGSCQAKTLEWIISKRNGVAIGIKRMHKLFVQALKTETDPKKLADLARRDRRLKSKGKGPYNPPFNAGYVNWSVRKVGRLFGMKVSEIPASANPKITLRHIKSYLENGSFVKVGIRLGNDKKHSLHAVSVESMAVNKRGFITHVRIFDPLIASVIEMSAKDFDNILLRDPKAGFGSVTVFE